FVADHHAHAVRAGVDRHCYRAAVAAVAVFHDVGEGFLHREAHGEGHVLAHACLGAGRVDEGGQRVQVGHRGGAEFVHAVSPPASASILPTRRAMSTGLVSKSSQPAARHLSRSAAIACAVSAITGMAAVAGSALMRRVASQPSITGSPMSIRISDGASDLALSTASWPSIANTSS